MQPHDFQTKQSQAIEYAQQMHRRSSDFNNKHIDTSDNINCKNNQTKGFNHFFKNNSINNIFGTNNHINKKDNDTSLILALILLLSSDGGDRLLLLALLYIMT